jgi:hypothetical protein
VIEVPALKVPVKFIKFPEVTDPLTVMFDVLVLTVPATLNSVPTVVAPFTVTVDPCGVSVPLDPTDIRPAVSA